jgi:hypothetical protein
MPDDNKAPVPGLAARKILLRKNGYSDAEIDTISTVEDADLLLEHVKKENESTAEEDGKKEKKLELKANMGRQPVNDTVPAPFSRDMQDWEQDPDVRANSLQHRTLMDHVRPLRVSANLGLRKNLHARVLRFYDEEYPEGRVG